MKQTDLNKFDKIIDELEPEFCVYRITIKQNTKCKSGLLMLTIVQ
jgi:hypothetical protein